MRILVIAGLMLLGSCDSAATARSLVSPYFPLQVGYRWEFTGDGGDHGVAWADGVREVQGVETTVLHWQYSGTVQDYLEQYYTISPDGSVLIHGFSNEGVGLTRSFRPPLVVLPSSLGLGTQWCSTAQDYFDLAGTMPTGDTIEVCFTVYSVDDLHLPAGDFTAYGVGQFLPQGTPKRLSGHDILGKPSALGDPGATEWYAAGVGTVAFRIYQYFELSSWSQLPTPTIGTTWGGMKNAFMPGHDLRTAGVSPRR